VFSFLAKKSLTKVDIHSHLIPQIDDGSKSMESSIELIQKLQSLGYKKLIITPHSSDMFPNSTKILQQGYQQLQEQLEKNEIDIKIELACEYYADERFEELLLKQDLLTFGSEKYLLFELSYFTQPQNIEELIYEIKLNGYKPVLAHPERYLYWHDEFDCYQQLKKEGVYFQLNINSLSGYYNKGVQQIAERLVKKGMVDFMGSDTHHMTHLKSLQKSFGLSIYKKAFKNNTILNDTLL
jgi:tyrosine-protein phosphatase YwqE